MHKFSFILIFISFAFSALLSGAPKRKTIVVRYPPAASKSDSRADYDHDIIELALQKSEPEFGPFQLIPSPVMTQSRALENLKDGRLVDVVATTSTKEREHDFLPIRHGIHLGLMGVKLLLIRKGTEDVFAKVRSLADLAKLSGGQGHDWPDVDVFRANGLIIRTGVNYEGLFKMLEKDRFDFFPRSLPEIFDEQAAHASQGLVIEPTLALVYPLPAYMFVNKENHALAVRLERGFEIAIADGSFRKLFLKKHGENIRRSNFKNRRVFYLKNPLLADPNMKTDLSFFE